MGFESNCYQIENCQLLIQALEQANHHLARPTDTISSGASFFQLRNGEVIVLPASLNPVLDGLRFQSKACFEEYRRSGVFPDANQHTSPFELPGFQQILSGAKNLESSEVWSYLPAIWETSTKGKGLEIVRGYYADLLSQTERITEKQLVQLAVLWSRFATEFDGYEFRMRSVSGEINVFAEPYLIHPQTGAVYEFESVWSGLTYKVSFETVYRAYELNSVTEAGWR